MRITGRTEFLLLMLVLLPAASSAQTNCNLHTSSEYQRMGGKAILGPMACSACYNTIRNMSGARCVGILDPPRQSQNQPQTQSDNTKNEEERRREAEERERAEREAAAARRAEEEKRKFETDKKDLLNGLKDASVEAPALKGTASTGPELKGTLDTPLGIKDRGPEVLGIKGINPADTKPSPTLAWKQLFCAASLAKTAAADALVQASRSNPNYEEADYIARESQQALTGGKMGVVCPEAPSPPEPYMQPLLADRPPPLVQLYYIVTTSIQKDVAKLKEIHDRFPDLQAQKEKHRKEALEKTIELSTSLPKPVETKKPDVPKLETKTPSDAEEALRRAKEMLAEDERAEKEQGVALKDLVNQRDILNKVSDHPELAPQLLNQIQAPGAKPASPNPGPEERSKRRP